jgi:hydrogenase expression/formation protein HypC
MCLGTITKLAAAWDDDGARLGSLDDGSVVTLAFVPDAAVGDHLLVHLGIPVEVLEPAAAAQALSLREPARPDDSGGDT